MKLNIHFYKLNIDFSPEHAAANHGGEESELNPKFEWEDHLALTNEIVKVNPIEASYPLQGTLPNGEEFKEDVPNMLLFEAVGEDETKTYTGCSKSIIEEYTLDEDDEGLRLKVYLKDYEPLANPVPGIYIATQDFPKKLIM